MKEPCVGSLDNLSDIQDLITERYPGCPVIFVTYLEKGVNGMPEFVYATNMTQKGIDMTIEFLECVKSKMPEF